MTSMYSRLRTQTALTAGAFVVSASAVWAADVIATDLIVQGSTCIGIDCTSSESFGFDTLRLKENNLRIRADDTSASASFPSNDWQLTFNDSDNGGLNKFAIDDITSGRTPFTLEAGAPTNAIYMNDSGNMGLGTASPVVEMHIADGDSPTLRLEQDGSSGFTAQTWDIASNETNFFVRDVTNGSLLPLKIEPRAPTDSLVVFKSTGNIGMRERTPETALHITRTGTTEADLLLEAGAGDASIELRQVGAAAAAWEFRNQASSGRLNIGIVDGNTPLKIDETANNNLLKLGDNTHSDAVIVTGQLIVNGTPLNVPDYVFEEDYNLLPLAEVESFITENGHLPGVPSAAKFNDDLRFNVVEMQLKLLEKVEELTLYTLEQEATITAMRAEITALKGTR